MKAWVAVAALLALAGSAMAKPAPETQLAAIAADNFAVDDASIMVGPAGASLERDYFGAPAAPFAAQRVFPCRMQLRLFGKVRLAQSCN